MRVRLDYGRTGLPADLPDDNLRGVLRVSSAPPLGDPGTAVAQALARPLGAPPLVEVARGRADACIVICDITRPVPNSTLLPPILAALAQAGIRRERVTILIATGTHRPNVGDELVSLVGAEIAGTVRIVNHDCHDMAQHQFLGASPSGVPVWLDRTYCDAALKITVGLIEPHFMAGYSGGRKMVMPGVAAMETVKRWHCPRFLESPLATNHSVTGNPVHEEALAIARMQPPDFMLDVTLDGQNRMTGVFAGGLEAAWPAGVEFAGRHVRAGVPEAADVVVTSGAGYPLDGTFYQLIKGMVGALPVVKPGGTIIIAGECPEGLGSPAFARTLREAGDLEEFVARISQPEVFEPEAWQVEELAKARRQADIIVVSGLPAETLSGCHVTAAPDIASALNDAFKRHGRQASLLAIPRGPYVIPYVEGGSRSDTARAFCA